MIESPVNTKERDWSLDEVLAQYMDESQQTGASDRIRWLERFPQFQTELQEYFMSMDAICGMVEPFRRWHGETPVLRAGNYELIEQIGQGGMSTVWKAKDTRLDRWVAVKLVNSLKDAQDRIRFRNEAEVVSALDHPNIVPVFEFGESNQQFFFAMKLIEGKTLSEWKPLLGHKEKGSAALKHMQRRIAEVVRDVAQAIHHAHQRGILHRDLKPSNVLLDTMERPYVTDFGLARRTQDEHSLTQPGSLIGTPGYMAPELIFPEVPHESYKVMTTAIDVYGIGTILYYLLTGQAPFRGHSLMATLALARDCDAASVRTVHRGLDPDLDAICMRCLEKNPNRRYQSADELSVELQNWLDGRSIIARPASAVEKGWRWCQRNRLVASLLLSILVAVVLGTVALGLGYRAATIARDDAITQRRTALKNLRSIISEINELENLRPDLDGFRVDLLLRIQSHLEPMLSDRVHGTVADETNFWLEVDAGDAQEFRGNFESARQHFERAMQIARRLQAVSGADHRRVLSYAHSHMGDAHCFSRDAVRGCAEFVKCLKIRQALVDDHPTLEARADLALAFMKYSWGLSLAHDETKDPALSRLGVEQASRAVQLYQALAAEAPDDVWNYRFLSISREYAANNLCALQQYSQAYDECQQGINELQEASRRLPNYQMVFERQDAALSLISSFAAWNCGLFQDGKIAAERAAQLFENLIKSDSQAALLQLHRLMCLDLLGQNLQCLGQTDESKRVLSQGMEIGKRLVAENRGTMDFVSTLLSIQDHLCFVYSQEAANDVARLELTRQRVSQCKERFLALPKDENLYSLLKTRSEYIELLLIAGDLNAASEGIDETKQLLVLLDSQQDQQQWKQLLVSYSELCERNQSNELSFGELQESLAELTETGATFLRLQHEFRTQGDWSHLASLSAREFQVTNCFSRRLCAVRGLAEALIHLEQAAERDEMQLILKQQLETLRSYGAHVDEMLAEKPG